MNTETVKLKGIEFGKSFSKSFLTYLKSPAMVWFYSLYFCTLFSMIGFNLTRNQNIFTGPSYYATLFFTYGLNGSSDYVSPWASGLLSWIIAPFLVIFIGVPLFFLQESGFSYNQIPSSDVSLGDYSFFNGDVYGSDLYLLNNYKFNLFYIGIVWLPILSASLITYIYKRKYKLKLNYIAQFCVTIVLSFLISWEFARYNDPSWYLSFENMFDSLTANRITPTFVVFDGFYHPMSTGVLFLVFHFVPVIVSVLVWFSIDAVISIRNRRRELKEKAKSLRISKPRDKFDTMSMKLPWELESEQEKLSEK